MATGSILIVEDDQPVAMAMARSLRGGGYDVAVAPDAVSAVSTARRDPPDFVLLDLGLPAGGGLVVLERLRSLAATSAVTVIFVTGGTDRPEVAAALASGDAAAILHKPVAAADLLDAVAAALPAGP